MKKLMKKAAALLLAAVVIVGSCVPVLAATRETTSTKLNEKTTVEASDDTSSIELFKDYILGNGSENDDKVKSPDETLTFEITPYGAWNVGSVSDATNNSITPKYDKNSMPLLGTNDQQNADEKKTTVTISVANGYVTGGSNAAQESGVSVSIPDYGTVGDFWYKVIEQDGGLAGVEYMTNDDNNSNMYFIHVQSTRNTSSTTESYIKTVTLHQTAPNPATVTTSAQYENAVKDIVTKKPSEEGTKKVTGIQNTYSAGELTIKKQVEGNAGDKNKRFKITVNFASDKPVNSDITYETPANATSDTNETKVIGGLTAKTRDNSKESGWTETTTGDKKTYTASAEIFVKEGDPITFHNIPFGVTYKVVEDDYMTNDKYDLPVFAFDTTEAEGKTNADVDTVDKLTNPTGGTSASAAFAEGGVQDKLDTVIITNTKNTTIDIGVLTSDAPYVAMLAVVAVAVVAMIRRRRSGVED